MLTHSWLKELLGPSFNLYLLGVVLAVLAAGILASWLHRPAAAAAGPRRSTSAPAGTGLPADGVQGRSS
jgi:hypothetical protein